jgi:hypothetical protein
MDVEGRQLRPGPKTRSAAVAATREAQRLRWRERQRRCRSRRVRRANGEGDAGGVQPPLAEGIDEGLCWGRSRHRSTVWRSAQKIADCLIRKLLRLRHPNIRVAVLEKVFMNPRVRPLLPEYYPSPGEAKAQRDILQNIRADLAALKIPHTSGILARKRVILEAVVSQLDSDISKFHSILGTRKENLVAAVERLRNASTGTSGRTSGRYAVPVRKKRDGGIPEEVRTAVVQWWTEETRVSPRERDLRRKRLGRSVYDRHATHLLMESQVLFHAPHCITGMH